MKIYKTIMKFVTAVENVVLVLAMLLVLVLTFGNVIARYIFRHSWGFTDEIVVAVFVLISMLAAGVAARTGDLVNLSLLPDHVSPKVRKVLHVISTIFCVAYAFILTREGIGRMRIDRTFSPILHIPKTYFWLFLVVGGISLMLHFIENCIDVLIGHEDSGGEEIEEVAKEKEAEA